MSVGDLFIDAQKSVHSHKSLAKRLRKLESKYIHIRRSEDFLDQIKACVVRLFEVAKSEPAGSRTVKFLSVYFATPLNTEKSKAKKQKSSEQQRERQQDEDNSEMSGMGNEMMDDEEEAERQAQEDEERNAVASAVLVALLPYLSAKDKTVRYRATQIISSILSNLDCIEDDIYKVVRHELMKRLKDRVPAIRLEAVMVLGPLVESEMEIAAENTRLNSSEAGDQDDSDYDEESVQASGLLEKLLDVLCNDTNADVRRALLVNLPISSETLPYLLERARDKDAATRRAFYLKLCLQKLGDFRHLSVSMREKILRWGLRDRDEKVRRAAARMFREKWIEDCAKSQPQPEGSREVKDKLPDGLRAPSIPALLELLERIDVINSGAEGGVALEAMKEFWAGRPDYVDEPAFDDEFWQTLSPESAFMARTWNDYCQSNSDLYELIENRMPEVTRFGFLLQHHINDLTTRIEANKQQEEDVDEEETTDQEFIVEQMLHIAHSLDYTDEIGRRKMFGLFRNAITMPDFPDECTRLAVEALRLTCTSDAAGEREFTSVILEAISEVHDTINDPDDKNEEADQDSDSAPTEEDSFVSAQSELSQSSTSTTKPNQNKPSATLTKTKPKPSKPQPTPEDLETLHLHTLLIQLKCLSISHAMLQNISGALTSNIHTENLLESLILPCVRSHDAPVREKGLECLGLVCLLDQTMARENWPVFTHCLKRGDEAIKILSLQTLCDVLLSFGRKGDGDKSTPDSNGLELDISPFVLSLDYSPEVQLVGTTSLGKLMLCGFYAGSADIFDGAVVEAETRGCKGWEILGKVRVAVLPGEEGAK